MRRHQALVLLFELSLDHLPLLDILMHLKCFEHWVLVRHCLWHKALCLQILVQFGFFRHANTLRDVNILDLLIFHGHNLIFDLLTPVDVVHPLQQLDGGH